MNAAGKIVVGVDGSESAVRAVRWAAEESVAHGLGLRIVHGFSPMASYYGGGLPAPQYVMDELAAEGERLLSTAAQAAREVVGAAAESLVTTEMRVEAPIPLMIDLSKAARMLVLGSSGRGGFAGMMVGSTTVSSAAHAACPVVVVRADEESGTVPGTGPVIAGVDGGPAGEHVLAAAFDEASWRKAPLTVVHTWSDAEYVPPMFAGRPAGDWGPVEDEQRRLLAENLTGWQQKYPDVAVEQVIARDRPRHQLLERAEGARLVVVGSRGRGGFRGMLLGSTSQALIHHAPCPVMVVRTGAGAGKP